MIIDIVIPMQQDRSAMEDIPTRMRSCAGALSDLADTIDEMEQRGIWGRILYEK